MSARRASRLRAFAARLRGFLRGPRQDDAFDEEMQEHLRLLAERFVAQGMPRSEAAAAARRQFGNTTLLREDRRALQTLPSIETLWNDLRYALRILWRSPGFAAVSITTLGLGIGAATAIFSVTYNVLLAPFPYPDAGRMVFPRIQNTQESTESGRQGYTAAEVLELTQNNHVFDATTAAFGDPVLYKHRGRTEQLFGARVTPGTFEFFGMPALRGRVMQPSDYEPGAPPVFVMRHETWMERFGGDLSILNETLVLNGAPRTLVGIMPPRFGWFGVDVYIPEKLTRDFDAQGYWFMLGRLKPGVSIQKAEADLTVIAHRLAKIDPQAYPPRFTVQVRALGDSVVGRIRATLYTVLAAVALLLLIACSNVANLMLARATTREKEFALRTALGAGRTRIVRLLLVEGLVLATAGAALGILLASGGLKVLVAALPPYVIPSESVIELNAPVLTVTLAITVLTALICGLAPALESFRRNLSDPLRDSGKGTSGGFRGRRLRDAVVVMEVALSLTLLTGAGLLMRSFVALREVRLGVQADHILTAVLQLPADRYTTAEQVTAFLQPLLARVRALPGVVAAGASTSGALDPGRESRMEIAGKPQDGASQTLFQQATEDHFRTMRFEFKDGRPLSEADVVVLVVAAKGAPDPDQIVHALGVGQIVPREAPESLVALGPVRRPPEAAAGLVPRSPQDRNAGVLERLEVGSHVVEHRHEGAVLACAGRQAGLDAHAVEDVVEPSPIGRCPEMLRDGRDDAVVPPVLDDGVDHPRRIALRVAKRRVPAPDGGVPAGPLEDAVRHLVLSRFLPVDLHLASEPSSCFVGLHGIQDVSACLDQIGIARSVLAVLRAALRLLTGVHDSDRGDVHRDPNGDRSKGADWWCGHRVWQA